MSGPYTEGWPKKRIAAMNHLGTRRDDFEVVPLSDAERMEEAMSEAAARLLAADTETNWGDDFEAEVRAVAHDLRAALSPEDKP